MRVKLVALIDIWPEVNAVDIPTCGHYSDRGNYKGSVCRTIKSASGKFTSRPTTNCRPIFA